MAVIKMQKIELFSLSKHYQEILDLLQKNESFQVIDLSQNLPENKFTEKVEYKDKDYDYQTANIEFAIKLLSPYAKKRGFLDGPLSAAAETIKKVAQDFKFQEIVDKCLKIEDKIVKNRNEKEKLLEEIQTLSPWKNLKFNLSRTRSTSEYNLIFIIIPKQVEEKCIKDLKKSGEFISLSTISQNEKSKYCTLIYSNDSAKDVKEILANYKIAEEALTPTSEAASPKEQITQIENRIKELDLNHSETLEELKKLAKHSDNLKITHDYLVWQREKQGTVNQMAGTKNTFFIKGWLAEKALDKLKSDLEEITPSFEIHKIEPDENEEPPVAIHNSGFMDPFEAVTNIYGLPKSNEVDPTPILSIFFIVFFALCLTDAVYGLILFFGTLAAIKFLKIPRENQKLIRLIMYGGLLTFVAGIFFGGWLGLTPEQAPDFLIKEIINPETGAIARQFKWQLINPASGQGPLIFLGLAFGLGIIQVLTGILVDGFWKIKYKQYLDAVLDSFLWFIFICSILFFAAAKLLLAKTNPMLGEVATYAALGLAGLLVLTQGRKQKNIVAKLGIGVLSLYNLVGYLSDVLSYSRIMALGLGTGIIAYAMNTIAGMASGVPVVGIILVIIIGIIGHSLNIALSTLGSFIHSGRLQFVEFFGKFMEGGGKAFKPFKRVCKYIRIS